MAGNYLPIDFLKVSCFQVFVQTTKFSDHKKRSQNGVKTQTSVNGVKLNFLGGNKYHHVQFASCGSETYLQIKIDPFL